MGPPRPSQLSKNKGRHWWASIPFKANCRSSGARRDSDRCDRREANAPRWTPGQLAMSVGPTRAPMTRSWASDISRRSLAPCSECRSRLLGQIARLRSVSRYPRESRRVQVCRTVLFRSTSLGAFLGHVCAVHGGQLLAIKIAAPASMLRCMA